MVSATSLSHTHSLTHSLTQNHLTQSHSLTHSLTHSKHKSYFVSTGYDDLIKFWRPDDMMITTTTTIL